MRTTGFTLIEMLITLVIASIILGAAYPAFNNMINENRLTTTANSFIGALSIARNEAIKRGVQISVVAKDASDNNNEWGRGWTVQDAASNVIRDFPSLDQQNISLNSTNNFSTITFNARGFLATNQDTVNLQLPGASSTRLITVTASGVTRIEKK
ncbi:GspH/FimT family pseudopilin [Endozoicomonas sp. SM1973]|uniref:Type II secretion system protein H n=1 Tax=Spartinivicinus marinus TaxID=2994442 RepID=A0A853I8D7_9GAMM|nr:GspH/FimT family pseudopilin [Spartinivicinus marinus]MCX4027128.1 GspH/FimT family pseudopilin [Spartinivicinus marinus]NYZ66151.1 GspH/FimT family pseudopilin [Spartinivicinus marinus]